LAGLVVGISQNQLATGVEPVEEVITGGCKPSLGMGDRQLKPAEAPEENTVAWSCLKIDPAIDKLPRVVMGQSRLEASISGGGEEQSCLEEHLEAIADPKNQTSAIVKPAEGIAESLAKFKGQDPAAGDVVTVGEATWNTEDLEVIQNSGTLGKAANMHATADPARPLKGMGSLMIAVGSGATKDKSAGGEHCWVP
jgi:hypothetical protein